MNPFVSNPAFAVMVSATCLFAGIAAGFDLRSRRIPNPLNFTMLGLGVAFQVAVSWFAGWHHLSTGLLGMLTGFGLMFVLWLVGGGGGGDVKLMAALGMWLGFRMILLVFVLSAGIVAVLLTASCVKRFAMWAARGFPRTDGDQVRVPRHSVAFATPVALATWMLLGWSCVMLAQRDLDGRRPLSGSRPGVTNSRGNTNGHQVINRGLFPGQCQPSGIISKET